MQLLPNSPALLLGLAALGFYLAARAGAAVLDRSGSNPGASAAAHWLPIAAVVLALLKSDPQASLHIIFASSVACMTIVIGATMISMPGTSMPGISMPRENLRDDPAISGDQRAWPMLLTAALLVFVAGFHASFTPLHALLLAIQGFAALLLWTMRSPPRVVESAPRQNISIRAIMFIGWIVLSLIGALIATLAVRLLSNRAPQFPRGVLAGMMLAPALVLPMIGSSLAITRPTDSREHSPVDPRRSVISLCVGCTLLNLCVLLPLTIILQQWHATPGTVLNFPMSIWRIDTVVLIVLGAALVPMSVGRWKIGRLEGVVLLVGYMFYVSRSVMVAGQ